MPETAPQTSATAEDSAAASRRIGRNTLIRAGGEVVAKVGTLVFLIAVARELGTSAFGDFTFALSLTTILMLSSGFGTDSLLAREVARDRSRVHHFLTNVVAIKLIMSLALVGMAVAIAAIAGQPSEVLIVVLIVGFAVAVENLSATWHAVLQAYERMEFISAAIIVQRIFTATVGVAMLALGGEVVAVSLVYLVGAMVGLGSAAWANRRYVVAPRMTLDRSRWLPMLRAATPIGITTLLYTVVLKADAALLGVLAGGEDNTEVGLYGAAFRLVEATMFLSWAFSAATLPWLAREGIGDGASLLRGFALGLKVSAAVLTPIGIAFILLAPELIELLYGRGYEDAVVPLRILGVITILYGINFFTSTVLFARDQPGRYTIVIAIVTVQNLIMNLILIPPHGAVGAAVAAATSGVLLAVLGIWQTMTVVGSVPLHRAFAAALGGALVMTTAVLVSDLPLAPTLALGAALYAAFVIVFERLTDRADYALFVSMLRRRG